MIWPRKLSLEEINGARRKTLAENLGIQFVEIGHDYLKATMPIDQRTVNPSGILHGGASLALAETMAGAAASLVVDPLVFRCFGLEINANHLCKAQTGFVIGVCRPLHLGNLTQVWEVRISSDEILRCICRVTMVVVKISREDAKP